MQIKTFLLITFSWSLHPETKVSDSQNVSTNRNAQGVSKCFRQFSFTKACLL